MAKLKITKIANCKIGNCQNWKLSKMEIVKIGNCQSWKLSELEMGRVGNCQSQKLSELKVFRIGKLALTLYSSDTFPFSHFLVLTLSSCSTPTAHVKTKSSSGIITEVACCKCWVILFEDWSSAYVPLCVKRGKTVAQPHSHGAYQNY